VGRFLRDCMVPPAEAKRALAQARQVASNASAALLRLRLEVDTTTVYVAPIGRSARTPTRMTVSARGREARTSYEVVEAYVEPAAASLLRCSLDTGRTHQIRVHLAAIGHPVVGDDRYGGRREPVADLTRFFLHAAHLEFDHPATGDRLAFESSLPNDLAEARDRFSVSS
jgi:23S rRNA pseudouridine1911/1915/1917 synthase